MNNLLYVARTLGTHASTWHPSPNKLLRVVVGRQRVRLAFYRGNLGSFTKSFYSPSLAISKMNPAALQPTYPYKPILLDSLTDH